MLQALGLAFGVAMDAAAIAAARSLARDAAPRDGLLLAAWFGVFQAGMAALGFALAHVGSDWFAAIDHWIAFGTLVAIGVKMLRTAWRDRRTAKSGGEPEPGARPPDTRAYLVLAFATSVDAAAVGMSLPLVKVDPWLAIALMGIVTAACTALAFAIGRAVGKRLGGGMEAIGGLVLIAIGIRVLVEHL